MARENRSKTAAAQENGHNFLFAVDVMISNRRPTRLLTLQRRDMESCSQVSGRLQVVEATAATATSNQLEGSELELSQARRFARVCGQRNPLAKDMRAPYQNCVAPVDRRLGKESALD